MPSVGPFSPTGWTRGVVLLDLQCDSRYGAWHNVCLQHPARYCGSVCHAGHSIQQRFWSARPTHGITQPSPLPPLVLRLRPRSCSPGCCRSLVFTALLQGSGAYLRQGTCKRWRTPFGQAHRRTYGKEMAVGSNVLPVIPGQPCWGRGVLPQRDSSKRRWGRYSW